MGFWQGIYGMSLKLSQALRQIQEFLAHSKDETVITCVKIEKNDPTDQECTEFDALLRTVYTAGVPAGRLYQDTTTMLSLGDVRGHVVLLRRDRKATFGLLANDGWPSNPTKAFPVNDPKYYAEHEFQFYANGTLQGTIDEKFTHVEMSLDTAHTDPDAARWWPMIFASASLKTAPSAGGLLPLELRDGRERLQRTRLLLPDREDPVPIRDDHHGLPRGARSEALINLVLALNPLRA